MGPKGGPQRGQGREAAAIFESITARTVAVGVVAAITGGRGGVGDARDAEKGDQHADELEVVSHDPDRPMQIRA
jgi:hypothetical protein